MPRHSPWLARLGLSTIVLLVGCTDPRDERSEASDASRQRQSCSTRKPSAITVAYALPDRAHVFENAGITAVRGSWVVAGMQVNATESVAPEADVQPVIVHQRLGQLPLPPYGAFRHIHDPIPVMLSDSSWGVVWADAVVVAPFVGTWPADQFNELWTSEYNANGWGPARRLLRTSWSTSWQMNRNVVAGPHSETWIGIIADENILSRRLVLGPVSAELRTVELPAGLTPRAAGFVFRDSTSVDAVVHVGPEGMPSVNGPLLLLESMDQGRSWSRPRPIWQPSKTHTQTVRMHYDRERTLHILWQADDYVIHHISRQQDSQVWKADNVPHPDAPLLEWVSGIDRCGRLAVMAFVLRTEVDFTVARWTSGRWSKATDAIPQLFGVHLFDGVGTTGAWFTGWSGVRKGSDSKESAKVWFMNP